MKVVFPQVLYDLIGDFAGDAKWRIRFTLTPKSNELSKKMFVVKRKPETFRVQRAIGSYYMSYRLNQTFWTAVTMQTLADEHCGIGCLAYSWESMIECIDDVTDTTRKSLLHYGQTLKQFCQTVLTYRLEPVGRYTLENLK